MLPKPGWIALGNYYLFKSQFADAEGEEYDRISPQNGTGQEDGIQSLAGDDNAFEADHGPGTGEDFDDLLI